MNNATILPDPIFVQHISQLCKNAVMRDYRGAMSLRYADQYRLLKGKNPDRGAMPEVPWQELQKEVVPVVGRTFQHGVEVLDLSVFCMQHPVLAAQCNLLRPCLAEQRRPWTFFIESCWQRAAVLVIPQGFSCKVPLVLADFFAGDGTYMCQKIDIIIGNQACVSIDVTAFNSLSRFNAVTYHVGEKAQLAVISAHQVSGYMGQVRVLCARESFCQYTNVTTNIAYSRIWLDTYLCGLGSRLDIKGLQALGEGQKGLFTITQHHQAPDSSSESLVKTGIARGAHGYVEGSIIIDPVASGVRAFHHCFALQLDQYSHMTMVPILEVANSGVVCKHGSAVERSDQKQLWYMLSRGIDENAAIRLLLRGFFVAIVNNEADNEKREALLTNSVAALVGPEN